MDAAGTETGVPLLNCASADSLFLLWRGPGRAAHPRPDGVRRRAPNLVTAVFKIRSSRGPPFEVVSGRDKRQSQERATGAPGQAVDVPAEHGRAGGGRDAPGGAATRSAAGSASNMSADEYH